MIKPRVASTFLLTAALGLVASCTPARGPKPPPDAALLGDARLRTVSCQDTKAERVKEIRATLDAALRRWQSEALRACGTDDEERDRTRWQEARQRYERGLQLYSERSFEGGGYSRAPSSNAPSVPPAARSASGTNNQVASVDEADLVKTDGRYVYVATQGALRIVEGLKPHIVSLTKLAGRARELLVQGDRAVVFTSNGASEGDDTSTTLLVFDISDRSNPTLVRQLDLSGSLKTARRIGNAVHTVVAHDDGSGMLGKLPGPMEWGCGGRDAARVSAVRAELEKLELDTIRAVFPTIREKGAERSLCNEMLRAAIVDSRALTSIVSFDLRDNETAATSVTLESGNGTVYASADALYLSVVHRRYFPGNRWYADADELTEIHKFRIGKNSRETRYVGTGIVPGHLINQFAMDESSGYLRVATNGLMPGPRVESAVSILRERDGGDLVRVGAIGEIAPGEDIRAVRFDGDRAYVVTFKNTDPLFVIDLHEPAHPTLLGELHIPGFSTYLHRIGPAHLLSIGFDTKDDGAALGGVLLQLFDVTKPTRPKLLHKEEIGSLGSSSQAAMDHLAFNFVADRGLLAVPVTLCNGGADAKVAFSGLLVYDVDVRRGFKRLGSIDHGPRGAVCTTSWSGATSAVKRSVFLDDLVYSIAADRMKVQRMNRFGVDVADFSLMPPQP